jgi:hypothetical protein
LAALEELLRRAQVAQGVAAAMLARQFVQVVAGGLVDMLAPGGAAAIMAVVELLVLVEQVAAGAAEQMVNMAQGVAVELASLVKEVTVPEAEMVLVAAGGREAKMAEMKPFLRVPLYVEAETLECLAVAVQPVYQTQVVVRYCRELPAQAAQSESSGPAQLACSHPPMLARHKE